MDGVEYILLYKMVVNHDVRFIIFLSLVEKRIGLLFYCG